MQVTGQLSSQHHNATCVRMLPANGLSPHSLPCMVVRVLCGHVQLGR